MQYDPTCMMQVENGKKGNTVEYIVVNLSGDYKNNHKTVKIVLRL